MGVMLSLDQHGPARGRRPGQHARHADAPAPILVLGQVHGRAAASRLRREAPPARGRLLAGLTRIWRARRDQPAAREWSGRGDQREWSLYPGLSVACLLGECRDESGRPVCEAGRCEHACHDDPGVPGPGPAAGTIPAA